MKARTACSIIASACALFCLASCSDSTDSPAEEPAPQADPGHAKAVGKTPTASVHRSHIHLGSLIITQYHTGEQPVTYGGNELAKVRLHYAKHETGEVFLTKAEVILQDGAVHAHAPHKVMGVTFTTHVLGRNPRPVELEQHFPLDER